MKVLGGKDLRIGLSGVVLGSICAATVAITPSKADFITERITDRIIQNVVQNILQDVRDQIQSRRLAPPYAPGRLQFTGEDANTRSSADDPFGALAYAQAPYTMQRPPLIPRRHPWWRRQPPPTSTALT